MRSAGWLFLLCCLPTMVVAQKGNAKKFLEALAKRYDQAKSLALEGTITTVTKSPSVETKTVMNFNLAFQRPNKFRLTIETQDGVQRVVSNGSELFFEFPALKQVVKHPAPKSGVLLPIPDGGILSGSLEEQLAKVREVKFIGEEKFGQRKAKVMRVVAEDGTTLLLWVVNNTLWQVKVTIEGARFAEKATPKGQSNPFLKAMKQTTITQTIAFKKVDFNPKLPPATFSYKPPVGYKVVEKFELPLKPNLPTKPAP